MTPMQEQYNKIKSEYKDAIVLFRLGDFYEAFDEDAVTISKVLGITLTGRGKGETRREMAGIPHHALANYLYKLTKEGLKVAIADQTEEAVPGKLVERRVTKLITPGTVTDENSLESSENNYIMVIYKTSNGYNLVYSDITTGELRAFETKDSKSFKQEITKLNPAEIICAASQLMLFREILDRRLEPVEEDYFDFSSAYELLTRQFKTKNLKGFGLEESIDIICSAGALIKYLLDCQKTDIKHLHKIQKYDFSRTMQLDTETIRNLELLFPISGNDIRNTVYGVVNKCQNPMGKRKLRRYLINPITDHQILNDRLEAVENFFDDVLLTDGTREMINGVVDLERVSGRLGMGNANPKDIVGIKAAIIKVKKVMDLIENLNSARFKYLKAKVNLSSLNQAEQIIEAAIQDDPAVSAAEGEVIKEGYSREVDELRNIKNNIKSILNDIQKREVERTGISSLKISFNKVFGYYIEITRTNLDKVPADYIRKQTLANAERFITQELKELEEKILTSEEKLIKLEISLFNNVKSELQNFIPDLLDAADVIAELDVLSNFGFVARQNRYVKPKILKEERILEIENGRHLVVEQITKNFIANSSTFNSEEYIHLLTGPNMSGKSTFIRQIALIVLLAQIGCFVPASSVRMSIFDRVYTRVGASDNLAKGESTFMVEMSETANILNNATDKSLVILDEVGRGTSTYDGVAIAWSIVEYIQSKIRSTTLFATHYHELIELEKKLKGVKNYNVKVENNSGEITFMHKIIPGATSQSYGVHVAKIAGVPSDVVHRAESILKSFESTEKSSEKKITNQSTKPIKPKRIHPEQLDLI